MNERDDRLGLLGTVVVTVLGAASFWLSWKLFYSNARKARWHSTKGPRCYPEDRWFD